MQLYKGQILGGFGLKAGFAVALIVLGDVIFYQQGLHGGAFGLFGLALLLALVLARPAVRGDLRALALIGLAAVYALAMAYDANILAWTLFWIGAGMATLIPGTGRFDDGWRWFQRLFYHGFVSAFGPAIDSFKLMQARLRRPASRIGLRRAIPVLVLPVLGSTVILALFAAANPIIEQILASITPPELNVETFVRMALWMILLTLAWSLLRPHLPRYLLPTFDGSGDIHLPGVSVASVTLSLIAFNLLFALQNAMDAAWLWELMPLPDGMTLAEYAHRGAYPLIATALLAALFVLVTLRPGSTTAAVPAIRRLVVLWIAQNVFLVASSILRTLDYVDAYSLTRLRIAALMWMGLVALGLVLICWRMLRGRSASWLINANLLAAGSLLTAVCFVDLGNVAARWNVRHAREIDGDGAVLDLCYLNGLGSSALLPLIELEQRKLPRELHNRVRAVRMKVHRGLMDDVQSGGWSFLGEYRLVQARALLGEHAEQPKRNLGIQCDGSPPLPPVILSSRSSRAGE